MPGEKTQLGVAAPKSKSKGGRPPGARGKRAREREAAQVWAKGTNDPQAMIEAKGKALAAKAKALQAAELTRASVARAQAKADALMAQVRESGAALALAEKDGRQALLALWATTTYLKIKPVSLGPGMGYECVEERDMGPNLQAMRMLMESYGDFPQNGTVAVNVDTGPRVVLMTPDNGRG